MSQTYYTNLTFLWYILPTASNILLHLLTLAALHTQKKITFFSLYSPNYIIYAPGPPHAPPKRHHNQKVRIPLRAPPVTRILGTQNYSRAQKKNENSHHKPYFKRLQKVS